MQFILITINLILFMIYLKIFWRNATMANGVSVSITLTSQHRVKKAIRYIFLRYAKKSETQGNHGAPISNDIPHRFDSGLCAHVRRNLADSS